MIMKMLTVKLYCVLIKVYIDYTEVLIPYTEHNDYAKHRVYGSENENTEQSLERERDCFLTVISDQVN